MIKSYGIKIYAGKTDDHPRAIKKIQADGWLDAAAKAGEEATEHDQRIDIEEIELSPK